MPRVRIDLPEGTSENYRAGLGEVVYEAMRATLNVQANDRFQIFRHASARGDGAHGRSVATKRAFHRAVADGRHARLGLRREDVFISLVEVVKENWSFGNGEAQYADP